MLSFWASLTEDFASTCFLTEPFFAVATTCFSLGISLGSCTGNVVDLETCEEFKDCVEAFTFSDAAADAEVTDELITGLTVVSPVVKGASFGPPACVTLTSSTFGKDSTGDSEVLPLLAVFGFSLDILESSSVWLPLTALETVPNVFLTFDMLRPVNHREAEVFKYKVLV